MARGAAGIEPVRKTLLLAVTLFLAGCATPATVSPALDKDAASGPTVVTSDIDRFWIAYDAIRAEPDEAVKLDLLNELYIDRGTPGLHAMNRARSYRTAEYLAMIANYPDYLEAVRSNTGQVAQYQEAIADGLSSLRRVYSRGSDVPIYFVIGAMRAGGTATDGKLLIGAELAMASAGMPTGEFTAPLDHLPAFIANDPISSLVALNLHEYVHTQQTSTGGNDLLSQSLFEGVAEYVSTEAIDLPSQQPSILFGKANRDAVIAAFVNDIDLTDFSGWIWNGTDNPFGERDLGYYIGYAIAEAYVTKAPDPSAAIAQLVELDYTDTCAVAAVVDQADVFDRPVAQLRSSLAATDCE